MSIFDLDAEYNRSRVIKDLDTRDVEIEKLKQQITALREAGEKMAERLRALRAFEDEWNMRDTPRNFFMDDDAAALAEWEAANK